MWLPNDLRISGEGAARQPPRRPQLKPTAWRLLVPARPRQLHALVRRSPELELKIGRCVLEVELNASRIVS